MAVHMRIPTGHHRHRRRSTDGVLHVRIGTTVERVANSVSTGVRAVLRFIVHRARASARSWSAIKITMFGRRFTLLFLRAHFASFGFGSC